MTYLVHDACKCSSNRSISGLGVQLAYRKLMTITYEGSTCNRILGNVIHLGDEITYSVGNHLVFLLRPGMMNTA